MPYTTDGDDAGVQEGEQEGDASEGVRVVSLDTSPPTEADSSDHETLPVSAGASAEGSVAAGLGCDTGDGDGNVDFDEVELENEHRALSRLAPRG